MAGMDQEPLTIERFDPEGAVRESAAAAREAAGSGTTRADLFKRGGVLAGAGLLLGGTGVGIARAQGLAKGDVAILNYALTLEYLEAAFYADAISKGELSGESAAFAQVVGAHEQAHVDTLKGVLGAKAGKAPKVDFGDATGKGKFLRTAMALEDLGVSAYQGQAGKIKSKDVLASAGAILAVEARHAAWVRDIIGGGKGVNPAPEAFSAPKDMAAVLDAVKATGFLKG